LDIKIFAIQTIRRLIEMIEKMIQITKEQLNAEDVEITMETSFKDDLNADSLDLFELVMALEEEFDVEIPSEDLEKLTTVGEVVSYLKEKGVQ
jgi:acyl carrier protein